jgi:hypothetical protein|eukprot:COSAG01_NODE_55514_length_324_cov_1.328889_2_plen_51_part_01
MLDLVLAAVESARPGKRGQSCICMHRVTTALYRADRRVLVCRPLLPPVSAG